MLQNSSKNKKQTLLYITPEIKDLLKSKANEQNTTMVKLLAQVLHIVFGFDAFFKETVKRLCSIYGVGHNRLLEIVMASWLAQRDAQLSIFGCYKDVQATGLEFIKMPMEDLYKLLVDEYEHTMLRNSTIQITARATEGIPPTENEIALLARLRRYYEQKQNKVARLEELKEAGLISEQYFGSSNLAIMLADKLNSKEITKEKFDKILNQYTR